MIVNCNPYRDNDGNNRPSSLPKSVMYHLKELETSEDVNSRRHINPCYKQHHKTILDIGCGIGQSYVGAGITNDKTKNLIGIDIDFDALIYGKRHFQNIQYINSSGDMLPIKSGSIDLVVSRVSMPYLNIPIAIREIHRVLKVGGEIWFTLHSSTMASKYWVHSLKSLDIKDFVFRNYVILNGLVFHFIGKLFPFPPNGSFESFQTEKGMAKLLAKEKFTNIDIIRGNHLLVQAVKSK